VNNDKDSKLNGLENRLDRYKKTDELKARHCQLFITGNRQLAAISSALFQKVIEVYR
jgi:hypothetical protein